MRLPDNLISPPLNRQRPKFRERCWPLTCACVPTLVRIGCVSRTYSGKSPKKWIQYRLSAYNYHSACLYPLAFMWKAVCMHIPIYYIFTLEQRVWAVITWQMLSVI